MFYMFSAIFQFLRPYIGKQDVYKPNCNFLEMAHTHFFSSIRKSSDQRLIYIKSTKCQNVKNTSFSFQFSTVYLFKVYIFKIFEYRK